MRMQAAMQHPRLDAFYYTAPRRAFPRPLSRRRGFGDYTPLAYPPRGGCSGEPPNPSIAGAIGKSSGGLLLAIAPATGPAAPFVASAGAVALLFSGLFGGHAKKVAQESDILCAAVPADNQILQQIYQDVQSGQITAQQASSALDQLASSFANAVAPIAKGTFGTKECNGACLYKGWLAQSIQQAKSDFAQAAPTAAALPSLLPGSFTARNNGWLWLLSAAGLAVLLL